MKYKVTINDCPIGPNEGTNPFGIMPENPVVGSPVMPSCDADYWDEQKAFFKRYE